ncbi:MAG: DUF4097 family beta strand repeat protein [Anaerolineae bacterium]|nr:DUF4097 family beta strand repeat protein [Gemmatimonadaceae bacterium]
MRITTSTIIAGAAIAASAASGRAQYIDDHHTSPRNATVQASGAKRLFISAEAGILKIEGRAGLGEVRVKGTARASKERHLEDIKLRATREGDDIMVVVDIPDMDWNRDGDDNYRGLDLVIEVPNTLPIEIEDGSGEIEIRGVGSLEVTDGSGELEITDVGGPVRVTDGSGELSIRGVKGNVTLRDGSGEIRVNDVTGDVVVDRDGSGEISATNVSGSVRVENDGSGSIRVADVGGDFIVEDDGSGGIRYDSVKGDVRIPSRKRR